MIHRRLGSSGLQVSAVCLGMMSYGSARWRDWVLDVDAARPLVRAAVEAGVTFFDTADVYSVGSSEEVTGRLLRECFGDRDAYVLATKVGNPMGEGPNERGLSRRHILQSIDASLRRLGTDHVDLYQVHRYDYETPIEETMEALHDVVRAGKVRYLGASSMWTWQFAGAQHVADLRGWTRFVSMQGHYNLLYREEEREMLPYCADQGVGMIPWSPLARGRLARPAGDRGTVRGRGADRVGDRFYDSAANLDAPVIDAVGGVADASGVSRAGVALAWLLQRDTVTAPVIGATRREHISDAVAALEVTLTDEQVAALESGYRPHPVTGHR